MHLIGSWVHMKVPQSNSCQKSPRKSKPTIPKKAKPSSVPYQGKQATESPFLYRKAGPRSMITMSLSNSSLQNRNQRHLNVKNKIWCQTIFPPLCSIEWKRRKTRVQKKKEILKTFPSKSQFSSLVLQSTIWAWVCFLQANKKK